MRQRKRAKGLLTLRQSPREPGIDFLIEMSTLLSPGIYPDSVTVETSVTHISTCCPAIGQPGS